MSEPHLRLKGVHRHYGKGETLVRVLEAADLTVESGELVAIVAPSGAGKSTLLHLSGLLERPQSGEIEITGMSTMALSERGRTLLRRNTIGYVYQFHHLLPLIFANGLLLVAIPEALVAQGGDAATLESLVAAREARLGEMIEDLKRLSDQVEQRVDYTVNLLAGVTDSNETASKVAKVKTNAIDLLKQGILLNDRRKRDLEEQRRTGGTGLSAEELTKMIEWIDRRIETRKGQMMTLAKSLPIREEVERYLKTTRESSRWRRDWNDSSYEVNPEWRHNRKVSGLSAVERKELIAAVDDDIMRLERSLASIEESISKVKSDPVKAILEEDRARVSTSLETRRAQKTELENPVEPNTSPVDEEGLAWLIDEFDTAVADLREDVTRVRALEDNVKAGRANINRLKARAKKEE